MIIKLNFDSDYREIRYVRSEQKLVDSIRDMWRNEYNMDTMHTGAWGWSGTLDNPDDEPESGFSCTINKNKVSSGPGWSGTQG